MASGSCPHISPEQANGLNIILRRCFHMANLMKSAVCRPALIGSNYADDFAMERTVAFVTDEIHYRNRAMPGHPNHGLCPWLLIPGLSFPSNSAAPVALMREYINLRPDTLSKTASSNGSIVGKGIPHGVFPSQREKLRLWRYGWKYYLG
jgi:hypothetical protein